MGWGRKGVEDLLWVWGGQEKKTKNKKQQNNKKQHKFRRPTLGLGWVGEGGVRFSNSLFFVLFFLGLALPK